MATKKKAAKKRQPKSPKSIIEDEQQAEMNRRIDAEHNLALIWAKFLQIASDKQRWPTLSEIAKETGLSKTTVFNHMKDNRSNFDSLKEKYAIFSEMAMFKLGVNAAHGKSEKWSELFFKVVHGIGDKKQLDVTSGGKPIGVYDISKLSDEDLLALKSIKKKVDGK